MYPNLYAQQKCNHKTDAQMAELLGVTRNTYYQKRKSGRFTPEECKKLCEYFGKDFFYLFANI